MSVRFDVDAGSMSRRFEGGPVDGRPEERALTSTRPLAEQQGSVRDGGSDPGQPDAQFESPRPGAGPLIVEPDRCCIS
jgi:hypothetical protein